MTISATAAARAASAFAIIGFAMSTVVGTTRHRVFYRRVELAVTELLICFSICLIFARIVFVEDKAAHAALFSVAVDIEARRLSEADIDIADFSDIGVFVVVTDIYAEHITLFAERLELAGVDVRYRRRLQQNRTLDALGFVYFIMLALVYSERRYRAFFVLTDSFRNLKHQPTFGKAKVKSV